MKMLLEGWRDEGMTKKWEQQLCLLGGHGLQQGAFTGLTSPYYKNLSFFELLHSSQISMTLICHFGL